jgi:hypothetical protein
MSLYLLKGSDQAVSLTSLSVFAVGFYVFIMISFTKGFPERIKPLFVLSCVLIFSILLIVIIHTLTPISTNSFMGSIIHVMGRDMTLMDGQKFGPVSSKSIHEARYSVGYGAFDWQNGQHPWTENMTGHKARRISYIGHISSIRVGGIC